MEEQKKIRKKRKRRSKKAKVITGLLIGIPSLLIVAGIAIIAIFGWEMTKQTTLLAKTVVMPYEPETTKVEYDTKVWSTLPTPGTYIGDLRVDSLELSYPVIKGTRAK